MTQTSPIATPRPTTVPGARRLSAALHALIASLDPAAPPR